MRITQQNPRHPYTYKNKNRKKRREDTLRKAAEEWLHSRRGVVKVSTYANYTAALERHILPELGDLTPEEVDLPRMEAFFREILCRGRLDDRGGLSLKTAADLRGVLKQVLLYAQSHSHPEIDLRLPVLPRHGQKTQILSAEDQRRLETTLFESHQPIALGVLLALYCGLRIGAVCALK